MYKFALISLLAAMLIAQAAPLHATAAQAGAQLAVIDRSGNAVTRLTDGDRVQLEARLASAASAVLDVTFELAPGGAVLGGCTIASGAAACRTDALIALGWHWDAGGRAAPQRTLSARGGGSELATLQVDVAPRPVVLVHGFLGNAGSWSTYLGDGGYLASIGLHGYAIGDDQLPGALSTGRVDAPTAHTNTIAENAQTLADYIAAVKAATGAQQVDLLTHSMGGLIARYYVDRVMAERDVAQLIMLGTPQLGSECTALPAALGFYLPAALEIQPAYVRGIFNRQITHRHGVPFYAVAGTELKDPIKSPCAEVPSDLAVSLDSAGGLPVRLMQTSVLHMDLNTSPAVFDETVRPLLQQPPGTFADEPDPVAPGSDPAPLQFTRVFTGHVPAGGVVTHSVQIDQVDVASFALFDPTHSLTVTVRGASGNVIVLDAVKNGLLVVDDPATLVYLGYGFNAPKAGPWQVTLRATGATPASGSDYALMARVQGGVTLAAQSSTLIPKPGDEVVLTARLALAGQALPITGGQALVRRPDGTVESVALARDGTARWRPTAAGLTGIDIAVQATAPDGTPLERTAFLAVEVQPAPEAVASTQWWVAGVAAVVVAALIVVVVVRRRSR
jgi:pimeloyl-ACP methyl ester carboxylesterase